MQAGKLRHKFEMQKPRMLQSASGENTPTFYTEAIRHGSIVVDSVTESLESKQITAQRTLTIRIRYLRDLDETWRIKYGTRYFSIVSVDNVMELNREMILKVVDYAA